MSVPYPSMSLEELALFNELLSARYGLHFADHKREILASRLAPRLRANHVQRFLDYYLLLQYDLEREQDHLVRAVTNNESYFFREVAQLEALQNVTLPAASGRRGLRILSAGCSAGEEPYTLRIFDLDRRLGGAFDPARIDALDIDTERLAMAAAARYRPGSLRALTDPQIDRYFEPDDEAWKLRASFRFDTHFHHGNLVDRSSLPDEPYDVVFCRNVLIYFEEGALKRVIENFGRLVRPGGLLFLGHAESIIGLTKTFVAERLSSCIAYRRSET